MKGSSSRSPQTTKAAQANVEVINKELPEDYYLVEGIRKKRDVQGQPQYLIKWLDWPESANTWEPVESLNELCQELIDDFEQSMATGNRMKPSPKHKRRRTTTPKKKPQQLPAKEPIPVPGAEPTDTCGAVDNVSMEDVLENIEEAMNEEDNNNVPDAPNEEPVESSKQHEAKRRKSIPVSRFIADPERPGPVRLKPVRPKIMGFRPPSCKLTEASSSRITSTKSHNIPDARNEEAVQKSKLKGAKRRKSGPVASTFQRTAVMMGADDDALVKPPVSSTFQAIPLQTSCRPSQASSSGISKPSGAVDKGRATMRQKQVEKEVNHGSRNIEVDHHIITSESPEKSGRNLIDAFTECMSMCKGKRSQRNHMRGKTISEKTQQFPARESIPVPRMDLTHPYAAVENGREKRKAGQVDTAVTQANADDVNIVEEAGNDRNQHNVPVESENSCQHHFDAFREISVRNHKLGKRTASKKKNPTREAIPVPRMEPTHPSEAVEKGKGRVKADRVYTVVNQGNADDVYMEGVLPETENIIKKAANDGNQHNVPVENGKSCQRYNDAFKESVATSKDKKSVGNHKLGKRTASKKKKPAREAIPVPRMEPTHPSEAVEKGKEILKADQDHQVDPVVNQGNFNNACMEDVQPETQNIAAQGTNELYQDNVPDASNEKPVVTRDQERLSRVQLLKQNPVQKDVEEKASASSNHKAPGDAPSQLTPLHGSSLPTQSCSSGIRAPLNHKEEETLDLNVALDREGKPIDLNMELQVGEETMAQERV